MKRLGRSREESNPAGAVFMGCNTSLSRPNFVPALAIDSRGMLQDSHQFRFCRFRDGLAQISGRLIEQSTAVDPGGASWGSPLGLAIRPPQNRAERDFI